MTRLRASKRLEQGVDEGGDGGALAEHDQRPEERQDDDDRAEPPLLAHAHEGPELAEQGNYAGTRDDRYPCLRLTRGSRGGSSASSAPCPPAPRARRSRAPAPRDAAWHPLSARRRERLEAKVGRAHAGGDGQRH